jgi:RNA polymerase sigma factor (sigma-70 family)
MEDDQTREFELAFRRLYRRAYQVAYRILGNGSDAEQAASEALARAYASWSRLHDLPHLDAWVLRVTANLALNMARPRRQATEVELAVDIEDASVLRVALVEALGLLARRQRDVIVLRYLVGMSEAEVAGALGISVTTVHTHSTRGVSSLRRHLGDQWEGTSIAY